MKRLNAFIDHCTKILATFLLGAIAAYILIPPKPPKMPIAEQSEESRLDIDALIERAALRHNLNPALIRAIATVESGKDELAVSPKGAIGVMQVMPANAKSLGLKPGELLIRSKNIEAGTRIFAACLKNQNNDVVKALMLYNGGPGALKHSYPESVSHAKKVLAELAQDIRG